MIARIAAGLLALASWHAAAEPPDPERCLTQEQRAELARRSMSSVSIMVLEARRARSPVPPEAAALHERAKRALAECESQRGADQCEGARSAAQATAHARAAASAEDEAKFRREMSARITERVRAVRREFPACD